MIRNLLLIAPVLASALIADTAPTVKVSPQSVECHYAVEAAPNEPAPVRCTVRLHVTPSKGAKLWIQGDEPMPDLEGVDGAGNKMVGKFRDWELCFDSGDAHCHILVYDFTQLPAGDALNFDTTLDIPVTPGVKKHEAPTFSTKQKTNCTIAEHQVEIEPLERSAAAPDELVLRITYTDAAKVPEIIICDDEGYHLKSTLIDADINEATGKTTAVYVQKYTKKEGKIALRTYQPRIHVKSPVKFNASIGRNK